MNTSQYQPHIDGIRCIAIIPVVLNHIWPSFCPGGFMGVDVFFVISGYLICGGIIRELEMGKFSIKSFFYRRIRRIFPAYFTLVICVLVAGLIVYHWARLLPLAQTALFSTGFSTNLYFWLSMGYFQPNAHGNPLLHLWSLGVEEHFYLIAPFAFLCVWKFSKQLFFPLIILVAMVSLLSCVYLGERGDSTTAFYILPTRAWEMLAGAMICRLSTPLNSNRSGFLGLFSLILIIIAYWCISSETTSRNAGTNIEILILGFKSLGFAPFPGWVLIPVVAGSALLIRYGHSGLAGRILSSSPFVGIGKISYSLYLWHWPVLVFARYINYDKQNYQTSIAVLLISLVLSYLSWRWIETPVRKPGVFSVRTAFITLTLGSGVLATVCVGLIATSGLRDSIHRDANVYVSAPIKFRTGLEKFKPAKPKFRGGEFPNVDKEYVEILGSTDIVPSFCLLGDSHSASLAPGLDKAARSAGKSGYFFDVRMHPFVTSGHIPEEILKWISDNDEITDVYLVGRWLNQRKILDGMPNLGDKGKINKVILSSQQMMLLETDFRQTVEWFNQHSKTVYVFSTVPEYNYNPCDIMARSLIIPLNYPIQITQQDYINRQMPISQLLRSLERESIIKYVPLGETFINGGISLFMSPTGKPFYRDGDHLTEGGASYAAQIIAPILWPSTRASNPMPSSPEEK